MSALPLKVSPTNFDSTKWVTVEEAAALTGRSIRDLQRLAKAEANAAFVSSREARAVLRTPEGGGKPVWHLHRALDPTLRGAVGDDAEHGHVDRLRELYPAHAVDLALLRERFVQRWAELGKGRGGLTAAGKRVVAEAKAEGLSVTLRTLGLWRERFAESGREGLIDGRARGNHEPPGESRSTEAIDFFWSVFRTELKLSVRVCHDMTRREAGKHGWKWAASYQATRVWFKQADDKALSTLMRSGVREYSKEFLPSVSRTYRNLEPGALFTSDHHQLDAFVKHGGKLIRPWITAVQDGRTRCIVGWHLGAIPSSDSIIAALRMAFRDWAIPTTLKIDNGKDFCAKVLTGETKAERRAKRSDDADLVECADPRYRGIAHELGIKVQYCTPYAPWAKGPTERAFGTLAQQCAKQLPTYCGNSPATKPESLEELKASDAPTLEEAAAIIRQWLDVYHRSEHTFEGRVEVPLTVWNSATSIRRAGERALDFLMEARGVYKVTANGVRIRAAGRDFTYQNISALSRWVGREVLITQDPDNLSHCVALTPERGKRRFIGYLESVERIPEGADTETARAAIAEIKRRQSGMAKAQRSSAARTRTAAQLLREHTAARRQELLATGTDGPLEHRTIKAVRTGFEGASTPVRMASKPAPEPEEDDSWFFASEERDPVYDRPDLDPYADDDFESDADHPQIDNSDTEEERTDGRESPIDDDLDGIL